MNGFSKNDLGFQIVWIVYALFMAFLLGISVHNVIKLNQLIGEMQNPLDEK
jgi:cell division protein FtsW (lipid II flippase)